MGGSHSREGLDLLDVSDSEEDDEQSNDGEEEQYEDTADRPSKRASSQTIDEVDAKLKALKLKYPVRSPVLKNVVKLYLHVGGNSPTAKWIVSDKLATYKFVKTVKIDGGGVVKDNELDGGSDGVWILKVGSKVRARVSTVMQLKMFGDQKRVDFVDHGVWALKFFADEEYRTFVMKFQDCLFENVYGLRATEESKMKVYGKDFLGWVKPEVADDSMWDTELGFGSFR